MPVQSCLYYLERSTDNRPISMIRTLQGHTTQSRPGQRVHQAIDFSIRHFRLQPQEMDFTIEPASLPPSRVTWMVGQR